MDTKTDETLTEAIATKQGNPCGCYSVAEYDEPTDTTVHYSCGELVYGKREFKPGHDAKLKSVLIKAFRNGTDFTMSDGGMNIHANPMELAKARGWEKFMTPAKPKKVRKPKADKDVPVEDNHPDIEYVDEVETPASVAGFQPARFKVGRWMKDGVVVSHNDDGTITVSYTDKKGERNELTLAADKVELG